MCCLIWNPNNILAYVQSNSAVVETEQHWQPIPSHQEETPDVIGLQMLLGSILISPSQHWQWLGMTGVGVQQPLESTTLVTAAIIFFVLILNLAMNMNSAPWRSCVGQLSSPSLTGASWTFCFAFVPQYCTCHFEYVNSSQVGMSGGWNSQLVPSLQKSNVSSQRHFLFQRAWREIVLISLSYCSLHMNSAAGPFAVLELFPLLWVNIIFVGKIKREN